MIAERPTDLSKFFLAGINYKKTDAAIRGLYAINNDHYKSLFSLAPQYDIKEFFVLSTCNRTEIYGFANDADSLIDLLCTQTDGPAVDFINMAYVLSGENAVEHLFSVAAGLDSQILGDYEIIGQIKQAVKFSKENDFIGSYLERMVNGVLQSSKDIRTNTELSGGTVSVSFAAVQYIRENVKNIGEKKIVLVGTGKIGKNTCKNMVDYLQTTDITLINRTEEKAAELAGELGLKVAPIEDLDLHVRRADIILVATNAAEPVILSSQVAGASEKLIIDLSIPYNAETSVQFLSNVTLVNVDDLSKIQDETLQKRIAEVPKAKSIISKHIGDFIEWHNMRRHVPVLKAVKAKLEVIYKDPVKIQKVINGMAVKMREQNQQGCYFIEAINEYIATGTN